MHFTSKLCVFCACIVHCSSFSDQHTASQHVFPSRVTRKRRCAYNMSRSDIRDNLYNGLTTQTLLDYCLDYLFGIDLRRKSGFIKVSSDFLRSFQHQFSTPLKSGASGWKLFWQRIFHNSEYCISNFRSLSSIVNILCSVIVSLRFVMSQTVWSHISKVVI